MTRENNRPHKVVEKILTPFLRNGYFRVTLYKKREKKTFSVHRLVAEAFIPNPENEPQINHINGLKEDNRVLNLEWVSASNNMKHSYKVGLHKTKKGRYSWKSKVVFQYDLNGKLIKEWACQQEAGKQLNIKVNCISNCCRGRSRTAGRIYMEDKRLEIVFFYLKGVINYGNKFYARRHIQI